MVCGSCIRISDYPSAHSSNDVIQRQRSPFGVLSMRAAAVTKGDTLDEGRSYMLKRVIELCNDRGLGTLLIPVVLNPGRKKADEIILTFDKRMGAIMNTVYGLVKDGVPISNMGYLPNADEYDTDKWTNLAMIDYSTSDHYELSGNGLFVRVIPSTGITEDNPLLPCSNISERGIGFTGRVGNLEKWKNIFKEVVLVE